MQKVMITGSEGLIGREITHFLKKNGHKVIKCSRSLGQDLTNEKFVKNWFKKNKANHLVNLFGLNEHIVNEKSEEPTHLFDVSLKSFSKYLNIIVRVPSTHFHVVSCSKSFSPIYCYRSGVPTIDPTIQ